MTDLPETRTKFPEPVPCSVAGLFLPLVPAIPREIRKPVWLALRMYCDAISLRNKPWPGWETFERELAFQFATLLILLQALPRDGPRSRLLRLFLDHLNFENKRGRARKAKKDLMDFRHGVEMDGLWKDHLQEAWNMKRSLENAGTSPGPRLKKSFDEDVVSVVLSPRATPESSLARLYAQRKNVSVGRAANALRQYKKQTEKKYAPQL
jgi:hypothetical protein